MKIHVDEKKLFLLAGLPRSGTTITARVLNSLENGFCIAELYGAFSTFKVRDFPIFGQIDSPDQFHQKVHDYLIDSENLVGGSKEIYWRGAPPFWTFSTSFVRIHDFHLP